MKQSHTPPDATEWDAGIAARIVSELQGLEGPLLPILHAFQEAFGCIPTPAVAFIAEALNLSRAEVHGVVSFYHDFRDHPAGKVVVKVCRAEACQAMHGPAVAEAVLAHFGLQWGDTTKDGALTIEPVYCLGLCAVAPSALINGAPVGRLTSARLVELLEAAR